MIYGNTDKNKQAYAMIRSWGLKNVALIEGGLEGYMSRGHHLVTGTPTQEITWVRKLGKEEVGVEEFLQAANGNKDNTIILDVRNEEETAEGKFASAIAIPLGNLENQVAKLPKDKEILVHCTTGARAEMALIILKKAGLQGRCLIANVECSAPGECEVD